MAFFKVHCFYETFQNIKLIQKIKFDQQTDYQFFRPEHQLLCLHPPQLNRVYKFARYHTSQFRIKTSDFLAFYGVDSNQRLSFKNLDLLSEESYQATFGGERSAEVLALYNEHIRTCKVCQHWHLPKPINRLKSSANSTMTIKSG